MKTPSHVAEGLANGNHACAWRTRGIGMLTSASAGGVKKLFEDYVNDDGWIDYALMQKEKLHGTSRWQDMEKGQAVLMGMLVWKAVTCQVLGKIAVISGCRCSKVGESHRPRDYRKACKRGVAQQNWEIPESAGHKVPSMNCSPENGIFNQQGSEDVAYAIIVLWASLDNYQVSHLISWLGITSPDD